MKFIYVSQPESNLMHIFLCTCYDCDPSHEVRYGIFPLWHQVVLALKKVSSFGAFWMFGLRLERTKGSVLGFSNLTENEANYSADITG